MCRGQDRLKRSSSDNLTLAKKQHIGEGGRDLLNMVRDKHQRPTSATVHRVEIRNQLFTASKIEPGAGFVKHEQLWVNHECSGKLHSLAFTAGE